MKILNLDLLFQLPDDFNGNFEDAILAYLQYRKNKGYSPDNPILKHLPSYSDEEFSIVTARDDIVWKEFWNVLETTEYKSRLSYSLSELQEDNTYIYHETIETKY